MRWELPSVPESRRPVRDGAIVYGVLAVVIVIVATATGGGFARALVAAVGFFVAATGWTWWRSRHRAEQERVR